MWNILRILTTNRCNYNCVYCHNEGQIINTHAELLCFNDFIRMMEAIEGMGFREIRFSGGEPLLNPETIEMIEWLNNKSEYEIGLATNGSMLTESYINRLMETRVMITMNMPSVEEREYKRITGMSNESFLRSVHILEERGIKHSFNFVLHPENIKNIDGVLKYIISHGKSVKLLSYIEDGFKKISEDYLTSIRERLDADSINKEEIDDLGIEIWEYSGGGRVKLLVSPCYDYRIDRCREYGELRLLPDMSLKTCIFGNNTYRINKASREKIRELITRLWEEFNKCV